MSERTLSAELISRISANIVKPAILLSAEFPSGTKRYWSGLHDITYGGNTYLGVGGAIGYETFSETTDTSAKGITARVNGLDPEFVNLLLNSNYQGGTVIIYLGFWDQAESNLEVMSDPLWRGILDSDDIEDTGETANISVKAEHRMVDILRKREFRCTDQDQQLLYPGQGDTFFNKIEQIQDVSIPWGRTQA